MITDNQINQLRQLLTDYYNGLSSPDQIKEINRLFAELPSVPADLQTDRLIFESEVRMADAHPAAPASLNKLIDSTIDSCAAKSRHQRSATSRIMAWSSYGSAAAVIAILLSIGIRLSEVSPVTSTKPLPEPTPPEITKGNTKETIQTTDANPPTVEPFDNSTKQSKLIADATTVTPPTPRVRKRSSNHVVTDPHEAAQCVENALHLLESKMKASSRIHDNAISTLNKSNEKINEIISQSTQL